MAVGSAVEIELGRLDPTGEGQRWLGDTEMVTRGGDQRLDLTGATA